MNHSGEPRGASYYGIAEWFGHAFFSLTTRERRELALLAMMPYETRPKVPCPFGSWHGEVAHCNKESGVCTLRPFAKDPQSGGAIPVGEAGNVVCAICPQRLYEGGEGLRWAGEVALGTSDPFVLSQVPFLEATATYGDRLTESTGRQSVGKIDQVLVHPDLSSLRWCALESQAVYFSGRKMEHEFLSLSTEKGDSVPFPVERRRPDFRSSAPKRLMPQLQIKVPTLRRWGKKMCVLVDRAFFGQMGKMEEERDATNCDIVWLVVGYNERSDRIRLTRDSLHLTTLERAVEGLTAGAPSALAAFEARIRDKVATSATRIASPASD